MVEGVVEVAHRLGFAETHRAGRIGVHPGSGGHRGIGGVGAGDESAETTPGFDDSGHLQLAVCAGHGIDGHAKLAGQFAHRGQTGARRQFPRPDSTDDLGSELVEQRCAAPPVDM